MESTNGHQSKRAVLYARVSTDEQARSGYSLAQQLEALREYAVREGYEVLAEVVDPGQSGASLERPGMDRVRDLVATGGVSVVLAQDRDRFAREPAYHYLLKRELEEHGCKIRALSDRGDDSPEGQLTDGILDQLGKYERAKMAERSRRGKMRKAREGKVLAGPFPNFGFRYNEPRDGYEVDEETMSVVRRIFRMVGTEGVSTHMVARILEAEGVRSPAGGRYWYKLVVKRLILDDVYKPHAFEEVEPFVSTEVAVRLDPDKRYGVWWFGRRRTSSTQVSEANPDGNGRTYRKKTRVEARDKGDWIAVPVPDAGIPREWVDAARVVVANYRGFSKVANRFWELSGGITRCGECGQVMETHAKMYRTRPNKKEIHYYRCRLGLRRKELCSNNKCVRADKTHEAVWELVSGLLKEPKSLREGLEKMIETERHSLHGDPDREKKSWLEKLAEVERKRSGFLDLAADGLIDREELRIKLAALEETRETAKRELENLDGRRERLRDLEHEKDVILESYAGMMPEALDGLSPEERHRVYRMLRLTVVVRPDGTLEVNGILGKQGLVTLKHTRM
ncbi:MAG: hypothetical protein AVDCRST_MAG28-3899 [uncultured Rubrobacteraceae bacterium]|uniref:Recombinase family protein n=1 Tax=uncultured Rubrobacteraceae bacterium TaxID=349277 RepID=A0A6J4RA71_9ACTN|nr:MAG: hypothetical protein AVDCRST_MAG28-3899 [uncultured Rubrobacteraceae bacterium]